MVCTSLLQPADDKIHLIIVGLVALENPAMAATRFLSPRYTHNPAGKGEDNCTPPAGLGFQPPLTNGQPLLADVHRSNFGQQCGGSPWHVPEAASSRH